MPMIQRENPYTVDQEEELQSRTRSSQDSTCGPGLTPKMYGGVTTGLGGVKRRFSGAQRSSSHISLMCANTEVTK